MTADKRKRGFTVIEMIVVFFVFGILLAIVFADYRKTQQMVILDSEAYKLAAAIRKQQSSAGLKDVGCNADSSYKYSYGIYFNNSTPDKYFLFSDCNGNGLKDASTIDIVKEVSFPNTIELDSITTSPLFITFFPPMPSVLINSGNEDQIVIHLKSNHLIRRVIKVNAAGMIDVQ